MEFVRKGQAEKFKNSDVCIATEYSLKDRDINGAVIELKGRYPKKGRVTNLKCKELAYVISGSGKVVVENKEVKLKKGDLVLIKPKERFFWKGNLIMFVPCVPAWKPEQHKEVK